MHGGSILWTRQNDEKNAVPGYVSRHIERNGGIRVTIDNDYQVLCAALTEIRPHLACAGFIEQKSNAFNGSRVNFPGFHFYFGNMLHGQDLLVTPIEAPHNFGGAFPGEDILVFERRSELPIE